MIFICGAVLHAPVFRGVVQPVSRTSLSGVPGGRAAVYAAVGLQGAVVVTFFVAVQLLLNRNYFSLPAGQHAAVYVPLLAAAVLAALLAAKRSRRAARGRVLRLGLALTAAGRAGMIFTIVADVRHGAVFFPALLIIGALTGAGFGLVYSAAIAFELDIDPARPERNLLRLTLTLAAGMAAGPLLQIGLVETGLWWALPLIAIALAVLLIAVSPRSRLGPDAARSCALRHPARPVPTRVKAYVPVAFLAVAGVVISVAWSQVGMIGTMPDEISARALGLGAFWAALGARLRRLLCHRHARVLAPRGESRAVPPPCARHGDRPGDRARRDGGSGHIPAGSRGVCRAVAASVTADARATGRAAARPRGRRHSDLSRCYRGRAAILERATQYGCTASDDLRDDRHRGHRRGRDLRRPDRSTPGIPRSGRPRASGCAPPAALTSLSGALTGHRKPEAARPWSRYGRLEHRVDQAGLALSQGRIAGDPVVSHRPTAFNARAVLAGIHVLRQRRSAAAHVRAMWR